MSTKKQIDFTNITWPFNLLKSNLSIKKMEAGEEIQLIVNDSDVLKSLILIIDRSPGYYSTYSEENGVYKLEVKKN